MNDRDLTFWKNRLIPCPREMDVDGVKHVPVSDIRIVLENVDAAATATARAQIENSLGMNCVADKQRARDPFDIILRIHGETGGRLTDAAVVKRLSSLPNSDQAYAITHGERSLTVTSLDGRGLLYGAVSAANLLLINDTGTMVTIPGATITDWPEIEERGLWLFSDPPAWIPWLASLKINWGEIATSHPAPIERDAPKRHVIERDLMIGAREHAFRYHPFIYHFNFLEDWGLYRAFPELAGHGDSAFAGRYRAHKMGTRQHRAPCASNPLFTDILAEWMTDLAEQGADEASCWLTERPAQCGCERCIDEGQFVLESRACVNAWEKVRKKHPGFRIRIFISTTTDERYHRVVAETPPDVKLERACATWIERNPHVPRDIYVNPLMDRAAAEGRWVATYDVPIGAHGRVDTPEVKVPCSSPHRVRDYLRQLASRGWRGAYGMMAFDNPHRGGSCGREIYRLSINALAEWAWNPGGRTEREFAVAWASREGWPDPDAFGDWTDIMGPIEFDVFDSEFPLALTWNMAVDMIDRRDRPVYGEGMFRYFASLSSFDEKIAACDRASEIAREFPEKYFSDETRIVRSYIMLLKALYLIAETVATDDLRTLESQDSLMEHVRSLQHAGKENVQALKTWRANLGPEPWHFRFHDALSATENTVRAVTGIVTGKYIY